MRRYSWFALINLTAEERGWKASAEEMAVKTAALKATTVIVLSPSDALKAGLVNLVASF